MSLIIRLVVELIKTNISNRTCVNEEVIAQFWVLPTDLDFNGHMTNNRYHTIMDYATVKLLGSHGILSAMFKNRWRPIVGCSLISHRRSLKILNRYQVRSKIIYCDNHWSYLSHIIEYNGKVIAAANRKYALVNRCGLISTDKIFRAISEDYSNRPSSKQLIQSWVDAEKTVLDLSRPEKPENKKRLKPQVAECKKNAIAKMIKDKVSEVSTSPCLYASLECAQKAGCSVSHAELEEARNTNRF